MISILAMLDEIYLKLISATIMQGVANKPIGVQMYTITDSSDHYVVVYCATHRKKFHIINYSCLFTFMATVANSEVQFFRPTICLLYAYI